ncbi:MAG: glycosyltransferase [Gemmataceae bacterium]|nr:glycosyltransferase [Gemmataceae bacterium]
MVDSNRAVPPPPGSICIVTNELAYLYKNGGIGTANWLLANCLAEHGWRVHILYTAPLDSSDGTHKALQMLERSAIGFTTLDEFSPPAEITKTVNANHFIQLSEHVRHALMKLHERYRFDLVEFAELHALGYRSIQAKRTAAAFFDVQLAVKLHGSCQWVREANRTWLRCPDELFLAYYERYAFEHADVQLSPGRYMLDYACGLGWHVNDDAKVVSCASPQAIHVAREVDWAEEPELVFFGRLEIRKGLALFIEALHELDPAIRVTFLGKETPLDDGTGTIDYIRSRLPNRCVKLITDFDQEQAGQYLAAGHRLAIIPSLIDNFPNTVIECMVHAIPFIAARVGSIPEIVADAALQSQLLFEPTPDGLIRCLNGYLKASPHDRQSLHARLGKVVNVPAHNRQVAQNYQALLGTNVAAASTTTQRPRVSVALAYKNMAATLARSLASIQSQTYANLEVFVIDRGSTDPEALAAFAEQERHYPDFHFRQDPHAGIGRAWNGALREATGEYFIALEADNIATPSMVERWVAAMERNQDFSALTCYLLGKENDPETGRPAVVSSVCPAGGDRILASLESVFGCGQAIYRTRDLRAVGSFEEGYTFADEGWEVFLKLLHAGLEVDVLPECLIEYRAENKAIAGPTARLHQYQHLIRDCFQSGNMTPAEKVEIWSAILFLDRSHKVQLPWSRDLERTVRAQHQQLLDTNRHVTNLGQYAADLERSVQAQHQQLLETNRHVTELNHHVADLEDTVRLQHTQLVETNQYITDSRRYLEDLERTVATERDQFADVNRRFVNLEQHSRTLTDANRALTERLSAFRYRAADRLNSLTRFVPQRILRALMRSNSPT